MHKYKSVSFTITDKHHDIIRRVAKRLKVNKSEVIRRRIKSFDEMLTELREDMKHSEFINLDRM